MVIKNINNPENITRYEYEILACPNAVNNNKLECDEMPHEDILRVINIMNTLRRSWKIKYPF